MNRQYRREYAEQWAALRRGIRAALVDGNYYVAAVLRQQLRLIERCWAYLR